MFRFGGVCIPMFRLVWLAARASLRHSYGRSCPKPRAFIRDGAEESNETQSRQRGASDMLIGTRWC